MRKETNTVMGADDGPANGGQVDAELFLRLNACLKEGYERIARARVSAERKARWQRRLIAITDAARRDLRSAQEQYDRFARELDRALK